MGELEAPHRPANRVDDLILRYADSKSPEEVSQLLGGIISPSAVAAHTQKLLSSRNWLTAAQEDQLVTLKMRELLVELEGKYQDEKMLGLRLKTLKEIGVRLDKRQAATETDLNSFYAAQAVQVGQVIELALQKALAVIRDAHPELEESEMRAALKMALPEAAAEIQARTVDE